VENACVKRMWQLGFDDITQKGRVSKNKKVLNSYFTQKSAPFVNVNISID